MVEREQADERLFVQGEIERLDREWEAERSGLMQRTKTGQTYAPQHSQAVVLALLPLLFFIFPVMFPLGDKAWMAWLFSIVMAVALWLACWQLFQRATLYQAAEADYQARRDALVAKVERGD